MDAAAAGARRYADNERGDEGHCVGEAPMRSRYTVARDGIHGTIEEGRAGRILRIFGPIPVTDAAMGQSKMNGR